MALAISGNPSLTRPNGVFTPALPHARVAGLFLCIFQLFAPLVKAIPIVSRAVKVLEDDDLPKSPDDPDLWIYLGTAIVLVLLGGIFAGLTIALMGQDEIYLQVIASSGEGKERKNAARVLRLLKRGKHWVLVTLLLSNVITNETLPIVLDRSLGGGWPAVLSSTVLIVIFGEVVPQSICVRYGLPIGALCSPLVLGLMWIMAPAAWPTAKLLDYLLGEDHGTTYKKAGLKTLVTLHKTLGTSPDDRLNEDEVTIITAVLDLKAKPVGSIMTPMKDVFTMSADTVLDEDMMNAILSAGYSRIPIHTPDNPKNFVGMLLVKMLITYDPEDALRVRDFALATLPETRPATSCLDIINFFQEGKSHMVLVSDYPGDSFGAVGVVTLEDVIEELIGEEIIDESDVFVDVHKAIRRMAPAPRTRVPKGEIVNVDSRRPSAANKLIDVSENGDSGSRKQSHAELATSPKLNTLMVRRRSSGNNNNVNLPLPIDDPEVLQHLKHLGPSNAANRPKSTRINTVKIKPGNPSAIPNTIPETAQHPEDGENPATSHAPQGGVGEGLLDSAGREASDAVHSLAVGYGTIGSGGYGTVAPSGDHMSWKSGKSGKSGLKPDDEPTSPRSTVGETTKLIVEHHSPSKSKQRANSTSTIGSLRSRSNSPPRRSQTARSGSISENIIDLNGVRKIVLETTSSSDSEGKAPGRSDGAHERPLSSEAENKQGEDSKANGKKKRKKRGKKKKAGGDGDENQPLLGNDER